VSPLRLDAVRRDAGARALLRRWRDLAGGARTVVACSGGADSTSLALALCAGGADIVLGHVVHDMRPHDEANADADEVRRLGARLDAPVFVEHAVRSEGENLEASLRAARYAALADIARQASAPAVATAHHADDQCETVLLALVRGAGPSGLAGVAPERELAPGVRLVRPMLELRRADAERICALAGVRWIDDPTNRDADRARVAMRVEVAPALARLHPHAPVAATRAADLLRDAAGLVADRAAEVFGDDLDWDRNRLRAERGIVVGEGLRRAALRLTGGVGADALGARRIGQAVRAVRDAEGHARRFDWPGGVRLEVERTRVVMRSLEETES